MPTFCRVFGRNTAPLLRQRQDRASLIAIRIIHSRALPESASRIRDPGGRSLPMSSVAQPVRWYGGAIVIGSVYALTDVLGTIRNDNGPPQDGRLLRDHFSFRPR